MRRGNVFGTRKIRIIEDTVESGDTLQLSHSFQCLRASAKVEKHRNPGKNTINEIRTERAHRPDALRKIFDIKEHVEARDVPLDKELLYEKRI